MRPADVFKVRGKISMISILHVNANSDTHVYALIQNTHMKFRSGLRTHDQMIYFFSNQAGVLFNKHV